MRRNEKFFLVFDLETGGLEFTSQIYAVGWCFLCQKSQNIRRGKLHSLCTRDEKAMLEKFHGVIKTAFEKGVILAGYNIDRYDKKMLIARGFLYDIDYSFLVDAMMVDLMWLVQRFLSPTKKGTLDDLARFFSIPHDANLRGADVPQWFEAGEYMKIEEHVRDDVRATRELLIRLMPLVLRDLRSRYR